jgi:hypothetical protein
MSVHRDRAGITRIDKPCPTCLHSHYPGRLWLCGDDYIVCPECDGTRIFTLYRERLTPPPTRVFLLGEQMPGTIIPVRLESV